MAKSWVTKLKEVVDVNQNKPEGDEWFTMAEFMDETKYGHSKAYRIIKKLVKEGRAEIFTGSEYSKKYDQLVRRTWYKLS